MIAERCWPPLGGSVMRVTVEPPEDSKGFSAHCRRRRPRGRLEVEFRSDAAGRRLLMEINARISQSIAPWPTAPASSWRSCSCAGPREYLEPVADYRRGVRLGWPAGEARCSLAA